MKDPYSNQKNTYLPYTRGILPDELRLGSLYLDPYNPNLGLEKYRFEFKEKTLREERYWELITAWTGEPEVDDIEPYILRFQATTEWAAQAKIIDAANVGADKTKTRDVSIVGTHARRYQIKNVNRPEQFLRQQVLTQPDVKKWIADRLSISFYARWKHHRKTGEPWKAPSIWLVTGVHLISNGCVHSGWNVGLNVQGGANVDPGTLAGGTPTGRSAADVRGSRRENVQMENLYGQSGERVWCAQFMELAVEFTNGPGRNESQGWSTRLLPKKEIEVLQLRQVEDLGVSGVRRRVTSKESQSSSIDWKKHQAMIIGLQTTGHDDYEPTATTDDTTATATDRPDIEEPLSKMVVADLPYNQGLSARDWGTFEDYLAYLDYQN
ncbi:hypothetical protein F5B22DRAFT_334309 [Xylaria bambusicola]|uniref:uncharacterized protein n=1 Tax=Xylaria bambusicola TaxID=326684 RepID=UPI002007693A|nr:uncharacterized protein F5B22DRAFT_334309 [Xylaria bambusicola]KAI0525330.1 hypothetical protein F5B22DRAFT_334309 [Xylaria bambusicola]